MAHYRKIDTRIWNDEKFRALSDDGKLAFFFLLTHPNMTSIGAMRATVPGLAAELAWTPKAFGEAFGEALSKGMAKHDEKACVVWLPKFIRYNPPENPNVLKAWAAAIELLPECGLTTEAIQSVKAFAEGYSEAFAKALPKAFAEGASKGIGKQEQEQEQEDKPRKAADFPWMKAEALIADGLSDQAANQFIAHRREKKAKLTELAWDGIKAEALKAGWPIERAVRKCLTRGWASFEAAWVANEREPVTVRNPWEGAK